LKKYIVDTNALISFVTDRNLEQQRVVAPLFEAASRMKCTLICHQSVLTEFVFVMDKVYQTPKDVINNMVRDLIAMPGVELHHQIDYKTLFALWPKVVADYGDAMVAVTAKEYKGALVVTFDAKFKAALHKLGVSSL
jgi:predicted nucleic-acid-binding protein